MFITETSRSKTPVPSATWWQLLNAISEMSNVHSIRLCSGNTQSHGSLPEVWETDTLCSINLVSRRKRCKQWLSRWLSVSQLCGCWSRASQGETWATGHWGLVLNSTGAWERPEGPWGRGPNCASSESSYRNGGIKMDGAEGMTKPTQAHWDPVRH